MHWKAWDNLCRPKNEGGIGFKDIEAFNLAMLGKQLWRLLTEEETLLAKVFKARYYSKADPLRAPLGSRPSYAWRSMHAAQELIKQGARVVIGNGERTDLWQNNWLDQKPARAILQTKQVNPHAREMASSLRTVRDLLDGTGREWRKDIIQEVFLQEDSRLIEEIRPGGGKTQDAYTWDYTKTGFYTVKSGYWVQLQVINARNVAQEVSQPSLNPLYQQIWKLQASPKIHHFLWRCLSNCLPVAGNLFYRHLSREAACIRCPNHMESVNHLLFQCTFARLVWAISPIPAPPNGEWSDSVYSNLHRVFNLEKEGPNLTKAAHLVPWLLWRIWKNRNELTFKGWEYDAQEVLNKAMEDQEEWENRETTRIGGGAPPETRNLAPKERAKWRRPVQNWVKCNTDGAWGKDNAKCGTGWVLRDWNGQVLWMGARALPRVRTVLEVELEAMRWAMLTMSRFQYKQVVFESDAQELIKLLNSGEGWPHLNPVLQDIRNLIHMFSAVKFVFTPRNGNRVADRIARESISFQNYDPKLYSIVPEWVKSYVISDNAM